MKRTLIPTSSTRSGKNPTQVEIHGFYQSAITLALKKLLEEKHLYQTVMVDDSILLEELSKAEVQNDLVGAIIQFGTRGNPQSVEDYRKTVRDGFIRFSEEFFGGTWAFYKQGKEVVQESFAILGIIERNFALPSIAITCSHCDAVLPAHNPSDQIPTAINNSGEGKAAQVFVFTYQCQRCFGEPIVFLVHRCGEKLTLTGRSHFEPIQMPDHFPKRARKHYRNAVISSNCNQPLAAVFYLRTLIEQHMRMAGNVTEKISGDELADKYSKTLPTGFAIDLPSLKKCYENLSIAIHAADEDPDIFRRELAQIDAHFEAVQLLQKLAKIQR